jgi:hypothetical protein
MPGTDNLLIKYSYFMVEYMKKDFVCQEDFDRYFSQRVLTCTENPLGNLTPLTTLRIGNAILSSVDHLPGFGKSILISLSFRHKVVLLISNLLAASVLLKCDSSSAFRMALASSSLGLP